jgi:hypothetical protein
VADTSRPENGSTFGCRRSESCTLRQFTNGENTVTRIDELLCNASEEQLRNVLAMANLPDADLIALFEREEKMSTREYDAAIVADDAAFAKQVGIGL